MSLPADQHAVETGENLLKIPHEISGPHPGFRPVHAKGLVLKGTFSPSPEVGKLSIAQHFNEPSTPILARFSNASGLPDVSDNNANAQPNGFALRFQLATEPRRKYTDIIGHSVDGFPGSNGDEALSFFRALKGGSLESYLASHPKATAFVQLLKPFPASFSTQQFFSVHAFKLIDTEGKQTFVRYRVVPPAGFKALGQEEIQEKSDNYLFEDVPKLLEAGPIVFKLVVQVAEEGDVTDDCCVHWPEERAIVELGMIYLEGLVENDAAEQKQIVFDPVPRDVQGVEASADPLLDVRAALYLLSGRERRAAQV